MVMLHLWLLYINNKRLITFDVLLLQRKENRSERLRGRNGCSHEPAANEQTFLDETVSFFSVWVPSDEFHFYSVYCCGMYHFK